MQNTKYVQFSKRMVVLVCVSVTLLSIAGMVLCWLGGGVAYIPQLMTAYTSFSSVCFVAYSGNSMLQKWLVKRGPSIQVTDSVQESENG